MHDHTAWRLPPLRSPLHTSPALPFPAATSVQFRMSSFMAALQTAGVVTSPDMAAVISRSMDPTGSKLATITTLRAVVRARACAYR